MAGVSLKKCSYAFFYFLLAMFFAGCGSHVYYEVKPKDTLYSISWRYNQDYRQVARWNDIEAPYVIKPGQWLRVAPPGPEAGLASNPIHKKPTNRAVNSNKLTNSNRVTTTHAVVADKTTAVKTLNVSPPVRRPTSPNAVAQIALESRSNIKWQWPSNGVVIGKYNSKNPGKKGVDIAGALGDIVTASAAGKVVYSGNGLRGYGNLIIIKHNDKYLSAYGHTQKILVNEGDFVSAGQAIAHMGSTEADRVKLHFEIRVDGKPVNPVNYLPKRSS